MSRRIHGTETWTLVLNGDRAIVRKDHGTERCPNESMLDELADRLDAQWLEVLRLKPAKP